MKALMFAISTCCDATPTLRSTGLNGRLILDRLFKFGKPPRGGILFGHLN
jgi:hypothetical protein